jgi:AraC-like DNA-binding protein
VWEIGRDRHSDLVEPRRAARRWAVLGIAAYVAIVVVVETALPAQGSEGRLLPMLHVAGIGLAALSLALVTARHSLDELLGPADATLAVAVATVPAMPAGERRLLDRLTRAMNDERLYRREGLTLPALAGHLGCGEAALRALVNQRLGHRNFNDFLHRYRIDEAAARLIAEDLPILTIALECGYGSIGPFNRAFKQRMSMTPTEYRAGARMAPARAAARPATVADAVRTTK